jgi:hypothetical protein
MKKINEKIKNLFKKEFNLDVLKVTITLLVYAIIFTIFYAGYEYRNVIAVKNKEKKEKIQEFKYYIRYKGDQDQYTYKQAKSLFSLLEDVDNMELDYIEFYEGKELKAVGGSSNFTILVNGEKVNTNFYDNNLPVLKTGTKIDIIN